MGERFMGYSFFLLASLLPSAGCVASWGTRLRPAGFGGQARLLDELGTVGGPLCLSLLRVVSRLGGHTCCWVMGRISLGVLPGMSPGWCSVAVLEASFPVGGEEVEVVAETFAEGLQADVLAAGGDELAFEFLLECLLRHRLAEGLAVGRA